MTLAYKTAISRTTASGPTKWLAKERRLLGSILDYGCGRGKDVTWINEAHPHAIGYDPHFFPNCTGIDPKPWWNVILYDTIICNFVLNVIESPDARQNLLNELMRLVRRGGQVYVSIRADKAKLKGLTKIGTWQGYVPLVAPWKLLNKTSSYELYEFVA